VTELLSMGLLNNPDTGKIDAVMRRRVLEMLEFGRWESADGLQPLHATRAELENRALSRGTACEVDQFDDHAQHEAEHMRSYLGLLNAGGKSETPALANVREHIVRHRAAARVEAAREQDELMNAMMR